MADRTFKNVLLSSQERNAIKIEIKQLKNLSEKLKNKADGLSSVLEALTSFNNIETAEAQIRPFLKKLEKIQLNYDTNLDFILSPEEKNELLERIRDTQDIDLTGMIDDIITFGDLTSIMDVHNNA